MQDEPSTFDDDDRSEPERPPGVPPELIWHPESQGWISPGETSVWDPEAWREEHERKTREYELAGGVNAWYKPPAPEPLDERTESPKSPRVKREQLPLFADDDMLTANEPPMPGDEG